MNRHQDSQKWKKVYERGRKLNNYCDLGELEAAERLLRDTLDDEIKMQLVTWEGAQALREAAARGQQRRGTEMLTLLLENGAPLSATAAGSGETALMVAAEGKSGDTKALEILLKWAKRGKDKKAALEAKDTECGRTALMWAAEAGRDKAAMLLVEAGADVNATCEVEGRTALMICAELGHTEVARVLLSNHADASRKDADGKTAMDIAKQRKGGSGIQRLLTDFTNNK